MEGLRGGGQLEQPAMRGRSIQGRNNLCMQPWGCPRPAVTTDTAASTPPTWKRCTKWHQDWRPSSGQAPSWGQGATTCAPAGPPSLPPLNCCRCCCSFAPSSSSCVRARWMWAEPEGVPGSSSKSTPEVRSHSCSIRRLHRGAQAQGCQATGNETAETLHRQRQRRALACSLGVGRSGKRARRRQAGIGR